MGSRGASSGIIDANIKKWQYIGNDQHIEKLQTAYNKANSPTRIQSIAKDARALEKNISSEINRIRNGSEKDGSLEALMAQRRKVRMLIKKIGANNG